MVFLTAVSTVILIVLKMGDALTILMVISSGLVGLMVYYLDVSMVVMSAAWLVV